MERLDKIKEELRKIEEDIDTEDYESVDKPSVDDIRRLLSMVLDVLNSPGVDDWAASMCDGDFSTLLWLVAEELNDTANSYRGHYSHRIDLGEIQQKASEFLECVSSWRK